MRKKYYTILLILFCKALMAQITISGTGFGIDQSSGAYGADGTYTLNNSFTFTGLPVFDSGTNQYVTGGLVFSGLYFYEIIRRVNGKWTIAWAYNNTGTTHSGMLYRAQTSSTDIDPPCNDIWDQYKYNPNDNTPTGNTASAILTGTTCVNLPVPQNAIITRPTAQSLPQLSNLSINAIVNPQPGMILWSLEDSCIKVYNGTAWNCL
ncbi:hypothetical protein LAG90_09720 [Marinilongibacter aquaticus]|uniref:hypothetical protein n=1 Tax=Marinilongibacter aquaticus TaxID=2975157 RepID=UPI0021BDD904|nr:hypothetical protein [Marinilongibacter aquaticus]UBM60910.1 hypothetical protein LAG90_09720 [Marinilongibacter aquaticus]